MCVTEFFLCPNFGNCVPEFVPEFVPESVPEFVPEFVPESVPENVEIELPENVCPNFL